MADMSTWQWALIAVGVALALYAVLVLALVLAGRRSDAVALARFIPDCIVLFKRLLGDPRVPRPTKALIVPALAYLAFPFDLIPDFIPVIGYLDDALVLAWALRRIVRAAGPVVVREQWPGPARSLATVMRLAMMERG